MEAAESHKKILIVDDDPAVTEIIVEAVQETGVLETEITTASNAEQARQILSQQPIARLILNQQLGNLRGSILLREIREGSTQNKDVPTMVVTAYSDETTREIFRQLRVKAYEVKPFPDLDQLIADLKEFIGPETELK